MDSVDVFEVLPKNWQQKLIGGLCVITLLFPPVGKAIWTQVITTVNAHFQAQAAQMSKAYLDSLNAATNKALPKNRVPVAVHP